MFGELVRGHRQRLGYTQEELAEKTRLSVRSIGKLEAGRIATPRQATVRLLAEAFGLSGPDRARFLRAAWEPKAPPEEPPTSPAAPRPRELPAPPPAFTGRARELAALEVTPDDTTVVVTAIDGMAGVGKTALAVQAAQGLSDRYPDGQLFLDLRGYTPDTDPVGPGEALERMLRSLGVPGARLPADLDDRAALFRSRVAGQRLLILLDNAADEAQVAPLLPGTAGCLVLITSRRRLIDLEPARTVTLDVLPLTDAVALFVRTAGEGRCAGAPAARLSEVVELCGRLPLAIRIAAARLRSRPAWSLDDLATRLRDHQHRLAELRAGQHSVTSALDLSYQQLSTTDRRVYRRLGWHPGTEFDGSAAAALAGVSPREAELALDNLLEHHLLQEPVGLRYAFHDLVAAHARQLAERAEPASERNGGLDRLLDYYATATATANLVAYPDERQRHPAAVPGGAAPAFPEPDAAGAWLDRELANLVATGQLVGRDARHIHRLVSALHRHLRSHSRHTEAETLHRAAQRAARAAGDPVAEAEALLGLAWVHRVRGQHDAAERAYRQASELASAADQPHVDIDAVAGIAAVHRLRGRYDEAMALSLETLDRSRRLGYRRGEIEALVDIGAVDLYQGRYEAAAEAFAATLGIADATGDRIARLESLRGLGQAHLLQGRYELAAEHFTRALAVAEQTGHRIGGLEATVGIGDAQLLLGRYDRAAAAFTRGLALAHTTGHRLGERNVVVRLGHLHRAQGRPDEAIRAYDRGLRLATELSDRNGRFEALQGLGRAHVDAGRADVGGEYHRQALALAVALRQPADEARARDGLARTAVAQGQPDEARRHWQRALGILAELGTDRTEEPETDVATIRKRLAELDRRTEPGRP